MKEKIKKILFWTGSAILSALGFSSCGDISLFPREEYGVPHGEFRVDIDVTDESGNPLKDITVSPVLMHPSGSDVRRENLAAIKTNDSGKASKTYDIFWVDNVRVIFEDTNGNFAKDSADFKPVQTKEGDNHWYVGEKTISGTQKLKKN